ncbi:MAG: 30S ribosomal protein S27ae [Candidatus Nanoarchaeia archaeon]|nr:30S ribosomal protein S27ae [Candidatus Nanoarchaeia archaeon]
MADKKPKNKKASVKYKKYSADGKRKPNCPKCGPGVFLAEHKDRQTCGTCGYTVFKTK